MLLRRPSSGFGAGLKAALAALALTLAAVGVGCRPAAEPAAEVEMTWEVVPQPPRMGAAEIRLRLTESATGRPAAGAVVRVEGNMSHPGMQPVFTTAREVSPGQYSAALDFTMAGDWILTVDAELPGGRTFQKQVPLPGVEGG